MSELTQTGPDGSQGQAARPRVRSPHAGLGWTAGVAIAWIAFGAWLPTAWYDALSRSNERIPEPPIREVTLLRPLQVSPRFFLCRLPVLSLWLAVDGLRPPVVMNPAKQFAATMGDGEYTVWRR